MKAKLKEKLYATAASESDIENAMQIKVHLIFISGNGIRLSLTTSGNLDERGCAARHTMRLNKEGDRGRGSNVVISKQVNEIQRP